MRSILSSHTRLLFVVTLSVFLLVLYLLHQLGDSSRSTVYSRVLPNYERTFKFEDRAIPQRDLLVQSNAGARIHSGRILGTQKSTPRATVPDDTAIFYIDPPDKPIPPVHPKPPLVHKDLRDGIVRSDEGEEEVDNERYDQFLVRHDSPSIQSEVTQNNPKESAYLTKHRRQEPSVQLNTKKIDSHKYLDKVKSVTESSRQSGVLDSDVFLFGPAPKSKDDSQVLAQEWQKLREQQHKLLEEKIRFQKEMGQIQHHDEMDLLYRRHLPPTDPRHWLGLNSSTVELRYPGILFSREYKLRNFIDHEDTLAAGMEGRPASIHNMTDGQAEDRFYQLLTMTHLDCGDIKRLGNTEDGGWDVCVVEPYMPQPGCMVYSFGINYDFTFDDGLAEAFNCQIRTFDPSMTIGDHMHLPTVYFYQLGLGPANTVNDKGWRLETMGSIMHKLGHLNKTIDVLKLDIEFSEWGSLRTMLKEGVLRNVKQLLMEAHTPEVYSVGRPGSKQDFLMMFRVLYGLEKQGFRKYHFTYNPLGKYTSVRTGKQRSCCYELYFINIRFLRL